MLGLAAVLLCAALVACEAAPSPRPEPQFEQAALEAARVWRAGVVQTGGLWARDRDGLYTSFDGARSWHRWHETIPVREGVLGPAVVVWDADRAWVVESGTSVARTVDGGRTWVSSSFPGTCEEWTGLTFRTAEHGYLVCWILDGQADFVAETQDGGVTWSVANASVRTGSGWFGTQVVATERGDLWAAALDQDSGTQPLLAGSRDGGRSWFEVSLPGVGSTYHGGGPLLPIGPPFVDGDRLSFAAYDGTRDPGRIRVWQSGNAGGSWSTVKVGDGLAGSRLTFLTQDHWIAEDPEAAELHVTVDAGRHWETFPTEGLPRGGRYGLTFSTPTDGVMVVEAPDEDLMEPLVLFVTQDGGRTWKLADLRSGEDAR